MNKENLKEIYEIFKLEEQHKFKMPLLAIDEPIFGIVTYLDNIYTLYVMQDRTLLKNKQLVDIKELLIVEPDIENLDKVIDGEISIYNFFSESYKCRIGKIADKIFAPTVVRNMAEISPKIVSEELHLSLSEECKTYYKLHIHSRFERLKEYNNFEPIKGYSNFTTCDFQKRIKNIDENKQTKYFKKNWKVKDEIYSFR
ncbi:hypothetical protein [Streptococcus gordonii]|uniref:hypothetical protein n=1 Tax=Streptococcus gordonii TaxID=1302 RepID=UPI001C8CD998|nr:hypothetical protein [Streptococcus gordonii]MBX9096723.1 hypothetical protein [Streptococcus gordonii]